MSDQVSAYRWVIALGVFALLMWWFSKLRLGYTILYYIAFLVLLTLILTQYQTVSWVLAPLAGLGNPQSKG